VNLLRSEILDASRRRVKFPGVNADGIQGIPGEFTASGSFIRNS
jgi:hypothetical protein